MEIIGILLQLFYRGFSCRCLERFITSDQKISAALESETSVYLEFLCLMTSTNLSDGPQLFEMKNNMLGQNVATLIDALT